MNKDILNYFDELFPNPRCELNYQKDYELLIAVMLSAQTTDKRVNKVTAILFSKYSSLEEISMADIEDVEDIIKEIGTYHRKSQYIIDIAKRLVSDGHDYVPNDRAYIESLPGVGHKSANVFLANIYDEATMAVDTHVARVSKRLGLVDMADGVLEIEKKLEKKISKDRWSRTHHQLVLFGRYYCKAISPLCNKCKIKEFCQYYKRKNQE